MKITRQHIQGFAVGIAMVAAIPLVALAARTAVPLVSSLFPNNAIYVNMTPPVVSLPNATSTGSLGTNQTLYFQVTALDGQGESTGGNLVGTTTNANVTEGLQLTWPTVPGAFGYRVYFSTSTPQALTQYFSATSTTGVPNAYYTFTSTSTPTYAPSGQPVSNTAYSDLLNGIGNSYILGGAFMIGTSTPHAGVQALVTATSTATTTAQVGSKGASGGKIILIDSTAGHSTCTEISAAGGTISGAVVTCP